MGVTEHYIRPWPIKAKPIVRNAYGPVEQDLCNKIRKEKDCVLSKRMVGPGCTLCKGPEKRCVAKGSVGPSQKRQKKGHVRRAYISSSTSFS